MEHPLVKLETEYLNILDYVCYDRVENRELIIHEISRMAELAKGDTPEVDGGTLAISTKFRDLKAAELVYPVEKILGICRNEDLQTIKLPGLNIHQVIRLTY